MYFTQKKVHKMTAQHNADILECLSSHSFYLWT